MTRIVPLLERITIDCVYAPPDRYRTPAQQVAGGHAGGDEEAVVAA